MTIQESYNKGYNDRCDGLPIQHGYIDQSFEGLRLTKAWRTGWFDADHDLNYTTKRA